MKAIMLEYIEDVKAYIFYIPDRKVFQAKAVWLHNIICHDTNSAPGLREAVKSFAGRKWKVVKDCRENTGYMTLKR